jgi:hypothetical protein
MTEFIKTTPQAKCGKKPNWRCGAPAGNQNAAKPVPTFVPQGPRPEAARPGGAEKRAMTLVRV